MNKVWDFTGLRHRLIGWMLDKLNIRHVSANLEKRGWIAVPKKYAERKWPLQIRTGMWHVLSDEAWAQMEDERKAQMAEERRPKTSKRTPENG